MLASERSDAVSDNDAVSDTDAVSDNECGVRQGRSLPCSGSL